MFPCPWQLLRAACIPGLVATSCTFAARPSSLYFHHQLASLRRLIAQAWLIETLAAAD